MDDAWQGRSRLVIHKLADDNKKLQVSMFEKELEIQRLKKERKKIDEQRKTREKNRSVSCTCDSCQCCGICRGCIA